MSTTSLPAPFGPYALLKRVGQGGMAEVFLASATGVGGFERLLCVKRILKEHSEDSEFVTHLIEEAKLVSRLVHPNIAQVFDLGRVGDQLYIAMEWIDGVDLLRFLQRCDELGVHVPVGAAAFIVMELARGLDAAHSAVDEEGRSLGIVHRDVSPTNVLLSFEGQVKLIDFGVAKSILRSRKTQVGVVKGKYNYLSPEQARGEVVDARTDIFAAGILLYELLAGEPLYSGKTPAEVLVKAREAKIPPLSSLRDDVPQALESIMRRALAKDKEKRIQSAAELADELEQFIIGHGIDFRSIHLAALLAHLFPNTQPVEQEVERMTLADFVPHREVSLVSTPLISLKEDDEFETAPTRVAKEEEVRARRKARQAGVTLPPVPPLPLRTGKREANLRSNQEGQPGSSPLTKPKTTRLWFKALLFSTSAIGLVLGGVWAYWSLRSPRIRIHTTPPGAFIAVDGMGTGQATPAEIEVERGSHQLKVMLDGFEDYETNFDAQSDLVLDVKLKPSRSRLVVRSEPPGAAVYREGAFVGTTPLVFDGLEKGQEIAIELRAPGHEPKSYVHRIEESKAMEVLIRLSPAPQSQPGVSL
ncbi:MAG: serine/threonine-protein kinase [Sandaracinaceae bacterium]|nr:serine/threonine-protein kinase [Sandaracinaceae bacterium]